MKKTLFLFVLLTFLLAACSPAAVTPSPGAAEIASPEPITLVDGLGRTVTLMQPAKRIVSLAPSATEILYAVGAGDQVVGRDSFSNYPETVTSLQDVGGSMGIYSNETILSLKPDLVVAAEINTPEQAQALEALGLTVYYIVNPANLDELYPMLETIGTLTGHVDQAAGLISQLKTRVAAVESVIATTDAKPVVFYEIDSSEPAKPWTSGPGTFVDLLIQKAGGKNVGSAMQSSWGQISIEELMVKNPEIIVLGDSNYGITPESLSTREGWQSLQAVVDGKVYAFNDDLVSRPGPRLVDGLEQLAKLIHPELFK